MSTSGQLNLYRCFIERGLQLLRPGGLLSFVVPASLLTDSAAAGLRQALLRHHAMDHVHSYSEKARVFPGTTQAVCVLRACRDAGRADPVRVAFSCRKPGRFHDIPLPLIESLGADLPVPRAGPDDWRLLAWLTEHAPCRFDSLAESFVGEVDQTFYAVHMKDEATDSLLARGCHLAPFCLDLRPAPGRQRFLDRPAFLAQKGKAAGACLSRAARERVVQLGIRNLSCRPRLVAARAPAGVFLGNSLNFFLPRPGRSLLLVTGLLNCALYDWRFRMTSGNNNINLREISGLPLPANLDARLAARVEEATRLCERTATQGVDLLLARRELDAAVCDLFGLPADLRHFC